MAKISPYAFWQELDDNGDPLAGGLLYTYEAGTSTPKATYTSEDEGTANANPVVLDSAGRADVWLASGAYKFVLKTAADVTIKTVDDIIGEAANAFGAEYFAVSTNTAITTSYKNSVVECTAMLTLSLLDVASAEEGFVVTIKNSSTGVVTVDPDAAELIDGAATKDIQPDGSFILICTGTAWISVAENYGTTNANDMKFTGLVSYPDDGELTIATGAITITGSNHNVDTEADAASDDLDTITGGVDGALVNLVATHTDRTVVLKDGTGNIETPDGADISLDSTEKLVSLQYNLALTKWLVVSSPDADPVVAYGSLSGLTLSNDTDTDHDINVTAGQAVDSGNASYLTLASQMTKQIDAVWAVGDDAGGLFTGSVANSTTYHFFVIEKDSDGTIDAGFDTSLTAANIPAGYTKFRRVGSVLTNGSANIIQFIQKDSKFIWDIPVVDTTTVPTTTAALISLTIPTGLTLDSIVAVMHQQTSSQTGYALVTSPAQTDSAVSSSLYTSAHVGLGTSDTSASNAVMEVTTDTSGQIRQRSAATSPSDWSIITIGWKDDRGI